MKKNGGVEKAFSLFRVFVYGDQPDHGYVGDVSAFAADNFYPVHVRFVDAVDMKVVSAFFTFWSHFLEASRKLLLTGLFKPIIAVGGLAGTFSKVLKILR